MRLVSVTIQRVQSVREVYEWYLKNRELDDELLKLMQLESFNKCVEPAEVIDYRQLQQILSNDKRFNDPRLVMRWWWIFDLNYAVIDKGLLLKIFEQVKDVGNVWTVVAIVQAVTGLNCGFVGSGRKVVNGEITEEEVNICGFIVKDGEAVKLLVFDENGDEVREGEVVIGFVVFD